MFRELAKRLAKPAFKGAQDIARRFTTSIRGGMPRVQPSRVTVRSTTPSPRVNAQPAPTVTPSPRFQPTQTTPRIESTRRLTRKDVGKTVTEEEYLMDRAARAAAKEAKRLADEAKKLKPITRKPGPSPYLDDAADLADDGFARVTPLAPEAPVSTIATETARTGSRAGGIAKTAAGIVGSGAALTAPGVINDMQAEGKEVPGWVEALANAAALGTTAILGKGTAKTFLSAKNRQAFRESPFLQKILPTLGGIGTAASLPAVPGYVRNIMGSGEQIPAAAVAEELPEIQDITPEEAGLIPAVTDETVLSPEEEYLAEIQTAIDTLIANAEQAANEELAAIDQEYQTEIDFIRGDYESRKQQIANNYTAALDQIGAYQAQADQILASAAAAAQAGYEQAAGGLQNVQVPTGLTAEEAALSGISPTAMGGAAISGAALARGLAGAEQAASAAQRFSAGVDLGGQLAETRGDQADAMAALERGLMENETLARMNAADRKAAARKAQASVKDEAARLESNTKIAIADKVANMTPEQLAQWRGSKLSKRTFVAPTWFGKRVNQAAETELPVKGLTEVPATVGSLNDAIVMVTAALQDPSYRDPATALTAWTLFFAEMGEDYRKLLRYKKIPADAGAMYSELFKAAPTK